jgi:hypothetical protein
MGQATGPQRLVIFYTNNGCLTNRWFPSVENGPIDAAALTGKTLAPLSDVANKLLFPRGLAMFPRGTINGYFDPHDQGMGSKLTGAPIDPAGDHWATGPSLDHVVAKMVNPGANPDTRSPPLVLSVGNAFANVKGIVSYKAALTPFTAETSPKNVYSKLTGLFTGGTTAADYLVSQGNSILDLVRGDLTTLQGMNMSAADRQSLQAWMALLRDTEKPIVSAACNAANASALGITDAAVNSANSRTTATAWTLGADMMINLIALNMMCDANRVIILQWPGFAKFTWDGMAHQYDHHGLSHRNGGNGVGGACVTGVIDMIGQIDTWYAGKYSKLVHLINGINEGERTMLDNSMVMWLPELADGNAHNNNNLPIVIAGSAGGYLKQGQSVNLDTRTLGTGNSEASCVTGTDIGFGTGTNTGNVPLNKLHVTLMNALGHRLPDWVPVTTFGTMDTNDVNKGITNPGELSALRA